MEVKLHAFQGGVHMKVGGHGISLLLGGITDCQEEVSDQVYIYSTERQHCGELAKMHTKRYAFAT